MLLILVLRWYICNDNCKKKQAVEVLLDPFSLGDEGSSADRLAFHTFFPHIASLQQRKREQPHHQQHGLGLVNDYNYYFNSGENVRWLYSCKKVTLKMTVCHQKKPERCQRGCLECTLGSTRRQTRWGRVFYLQSAAPFSLPLSLRVWFADVVSTLFFRDLSEC